MGAPALGTSDARPNFGLDYAPGVDHVCFISCIFIHTLYFHIVIVFCIFVMHKTSMITCHLYQVIELRKNSAAPPLNEKSSLKAALWEHI